MPVTRKMARTPEAQTTDRPDSMVMATELVKDILEARLAFAIGNLDDKVKLNLPRLFRKHFEPGLIEIQFSDPGYADDIKKDLRRAICWALSVSGPRTWQRYSSTSVAMGVLWDSYRAIISEQNMLTAVHETHLDWVEEQFIAIADQSNFDELPCDGLYRSFANWLIPECSLTREEVRIHLLNLYGDQYFVHNVTRVSTLVIRCLQCPYNQRVVFAEQEGTGSQGEEARQDKDRREIR
jgi:hypothetical protein